MIAAKKKLYLITLLLFTFSGLAQDITVNVVVSATDSNVKNTILSKFKNDLRGLSNIKIDDSNPKFFISVNTAEIKSESGELVGISMSTLLTKKVALDSSKVVYPVLTDVINSLKISEIEAKCSDIVARFDVEYFENER